MADDRNSVDLVRRLRLLQEGFQRTLWSAKENRIKRASHVASSMLRYVAVCRLTRTFKPERTPSLPAAERLDSPKPTTAFIMGGFTPSDRSRHCVIPTQPV